MDQRERNMESRNSCQRLKNLTCVLHGSLACQTPLGAELSFNESPKPGCMGKWDRARFWGAMIINYLVAAMNKSRTFEKTSSMASGFGKGVPLLVFNEGPWGLNLISSME